MIDPTVIVAILGTVGTIVSGVIVYLNKRKASKEGMQTSFQQIAAEMITDQVKSFASENEKLINRLDTLANAEKQNERLIEELRAEVFSMRIRITSIAATLQSLAQFAEGLVTLYDIKDEDEFKNLLRSHHEAIKSAITTLLEEEGRDKQ